MRLFRKRRNYGIRGFTATELLAVAAIVTSIPTASYMRGQQKAYEIECKNNLQQIGQMIQMYYASNGEYPDAAFYPEKPLQDSDSIITVMKQGGMRVPPEMWVCPAAPEKLKEKKLTFVYNDIFGGRRSLPRPSKAWVMIEVHCVSKDVPPPHPSGYNILFADGHVVTTEKLPRSITSKQEAALQKLYEDVMDGRQMAQAK